MSRTEETAYTFQISFIIQPYKQKHLIRALVNNSRLTLSDFSVMLGLSIDKIKAVYSGEGFLNEKEAARVVEYFCLFFGE